MITLGIDPGTACTGYGIIEHQANVLYLIDYGCILTSSKESTPKRLQTIYDRAIDLVKRYQPKELVVEGLFFNANTKTALAVGQAKGVVLLAAANCSLNVSEYTPLQVKQAVVGYGKASKKQVQSMVGTLLGLPEPPKPDDAADALALAICHIHSQGLIGLLGATR